MTNTPASIIFIPVPIPVAGSQEPLRRAKPVYPTKRCERRWPLNQPVPKYTPDPAQIEALKRGGKALLEQVRLQRVVHG